jgi:hypothetical protein
MNSAASATANLPKCLVKTRSLSVVEKNEKLQYNITIFNPCRTAGNVLHAPAAGLYSEKMRGVAPPSAGTGAGSTAVRPFAYRHFYFTDLQWLIMT